VALGAISFNRWTKSALSVSNAIMTLDVLLGVYFAERSNKQPTTFKGPCRDLHCSEQAIRSIVERLKESRWIVLEQDDRLRRTISRLRTPADKVGILDRASGSSKDKSMVLLFPGPSDVSGHVVSFSLGCAWGRSHA